MELTAYELELQAKGNFFFEKPTIIESEPVMYLHNGKQVTVWKPIHEKVANPWRQQDRGRWHIG